MQGISAAEFEAMALPATVRCARPGELRDFDCMTFESIAPLRSNIRAIESGVRFAGGVNRFVAIHGPSGSGKTHILSAAAKRLRSEIGAHVPVLSAADWLADARLRAMGGPLILDNAQDLVNKTRSRCQLQLALERRVRAGKSTLLAFTEPRVTRAMRQSLPTFREWVVAEIAEPSAAERARIVRKMSESLGIALDDDLVRILACRMAGSSTALKGALTRLSLQSADWVGSLATVRACGVLDLFFASNPEWDLREHVSDCARLLPAEDMAHVSPFDLAVYTMLRIALLPEDRVAKFFRIEPAKAYGYAGRFEERVLSCSAVAGVASRFLDRLAAQL